MKTVSIEEAQKNIDKLIKYVNETNDTVIVGKKGSGEALLSKIPNNSDKETNIGAFFGAFDFLNDEPDIYTIDDLKKRYV
ncbi:MAG: hypothetical protein ACI9GH_000265 [Candidatus Paceibacteria bacterium]|jgi:hypothetical protein